MVCSVRQLLDNNAYNIEQDSCCLTVCRSIFLLEEIPRVARLSAVTACSFVFQQLISVEEKGRRFVELPQLNTDRLENR